VCSLVSAEELSVFARLVLKFARLKHCLGDTRVLALLDSIFNVQVDLVAHFVTTADTALGMLLCTLSLVSFSLSISHLNDALMSKGELLLNLFRCGMFSRHPGVTNDVGHRQPLVGMQLEHARDQILEFFREEAGFMALAVQFPEEVRPVRRDQFIERIAGLSLCEGWVLGVQNEQNDSKCKQIHDVALVGLLI